MRMKVFLLAIFVFSALNSASAQTAYNNPQPSQPPLDPMANISMELSRISRSVAVLSQTLAQFVDKFEKVGGMTLTEKQQRMVMGLEILVRSEQRVATLQKAHSDLVEKQIQVRSRLSQIEIDLRPQSIERTTQLEGSTQTVELRENRREKLVSEQRSMNLLMQQIERNIAEAESALREAQAHVLRLRRTLLPQIEREIENTGY